MLIGRNAPCPCGSGKKYKRCCGLKQAETVENNYEAEEDESDAVYGWYETINNMHRYMLEKKPHIKEYKKIRRLHSAIINDMAAYFDQGKFVQKIDVDYAVRMQLESKDDGAKRGPLLTRESDFDLNTREGMQGFYDMIIYKPAPNINCITEEFISSHKYRKPEKIEFLQSMLEAKLGLFEVTGIEPDDGFAYVKEVFTGRTYKLTDLGLSGGTNGSAYYIYTRIITYQNVSFSTGLNLVFIETDPFITGFINRQKKDYDDLDELGRFVELYNRFSKDTHAVKITTNSF